MHSTLLIFFPRTHCGAQFLRRTVKKLKSAAAQLHDDDERMHACTMLNLGEVLLWLAGCTEEALGLLQQARVAVDSISHQSSLVSMCDEFNVTSTHARPGIIHFRFFCVAISVIHLKACTITLLCSMHAPHSFATQIQQCLAKPGLCVANCYAVPDKLCPACVYHDIIFPLDWNSMSISVGRDLV